MVGEITSSCCDSSSVSLSMCDHMSESFQGQSLCSSGVLFVLVTLLMLSGLCNEGEYCKIKRGG